MKIQDVWNGAAGGLIGEVVEWDIYKFKELDFIPDVCIDLGANIGVASRYVRELFPYCKIISVEPNKENCEIFRQFTNDENITLIEKAIGNGNVWHGLTASNGSGETYFTNGVGYPESEMSKNHSMELSKVETISLSSLVETYVNPTDKLIIKLDIEGNEHVILFDEKEMNALRRADYIAGEIHFYAINGLYWQEVQDKTRVALKSLETTHDCELDNVNFWAKKIR